MAGISLREYQESAIENIRNSIRAGNKRIILQANCGAGKTIIAAFIVKSALAKGKKVLFMVHFRQLAYQAMQRFSDCGLGAQVGYIMAGEEPELDKPVQIISVQTYGRRLNLDDIKYNPWFKDADIIIYDEAHSSIAETRKAILDLYSNSIILGLTATPCRADGRPLGGIYQDIVQCISISELTELGFLVPARYFTANQLPDLNGITTVAGDYSQKELGVRVNKKALVGDILENFLRIAPKRQTVVFATNVKHSKYIRDTFRGHGITVEHIDARTPHEDRQEILSRFESGEIQVVTNVNVFSEGADFPWATCVILAKPTKSYARFIQMASRPLRPYFAKENAIIIDHARNIEMHGLLEDSVIWSLNGKEKAWKKAKKTEKEKHTMTCEICNAVFYGNRCPDCGHEIKDYGKKIEMIEAELHEIKESKAKKRYTTFEKREWYGMLAYEQRRLGKSDKWLLAQYKTKFGVWPRSMDDVPMFPPTREVKNWLTYQRVKWIKGKRAA